MKLRTLKHLPVVSFLRNWANGEFEVGTRGIIKYHLHIAYAMIPIVYTIGTILYGTPNILRWNEIAQERQAEVQKQETLRKRAFKLADKDGIEGLSLTELDDLYSRADVSLKIKDIMAKLPRLTTQDLERAIKSYELEKR